MRSPQWFARCGGKGSFDALRQATPPADAGGAERVKILSAIESMSAGGSTNGARGILTAYQTVRRNYVPGGNNRVILATDGDFNVGVSSEAELVRLIERERNDGISLTVLGFGTGNYQDATMEAPAAVAEWGMLLRNSAHRGSASYDGVLARARAARGPDLQGHRADFVRLVEASRRLRF